jgi:hypothetical protein
MPADRPAVISCRRRQSSAGMVAAAKLGGLCVFLTVQQHFGGLILFLQVMVIHLLWCLRVHTTSHT